MKKKKLVSINESDLMAKHAFNMIFFVWLHQHSFCVYFSALIFPLARKRNYLEFGKIREQNVNLNEIQILGTIFQF